MVFQVFQVFVVRDLQGSYEKVYDLSSPSSLPHDYMETARSHALEGCYVLGLGRR